MGFHIFHYIKKNYISSNSKIIVWRRLVRTDLTDAVVVIYIIICILILNVAKNPSLRVKFTILGFSFVEQRAEAFLINYY